MGNPGKNCKNAAVEFLKLTTSGRVAEAFNLYVATDFRHHNIHFKGDADSFKEAMEESAKMLPNKELEILFAIQEESRVAIYSKVVISQGEPGIALAHFFRFSEDKIVELWDMVQPPPDEMINENGLF